ncbi:MAG: response regulator [Chloroflexi bacterium]|nr:response regulator [Chloroflexota bacterium]
MQVRSAEIVLVEDDPYDAELTLRVIKRHWQGCSAEWVRDGQEALEILPLLKPPPKLVLLDLNLPKVGGLEVLRALKGNPQTRAIPVVMLTSSQEERDLAESYRWGTNSYILKPTPFEEFVQIVQEVLSYWLLLNIRPIVPLSGGHQEA